MTGRTRQTGSVVTAGADRVRQAAVAADLVAALGAVTVSIRAIARVARVRAAGAPAARVGAVAEHAVVARIRIVRVELLTLVRPCLYMRYHGIGEFTAFDFFGVIHEPCEVIGDNLR